MIALALLIAVTPPAIDRPVVDAANVLDVHEEGDLASELQRVRAHGAPMAVLVVATTEGLRIDDYAKQAATQWDGLLLVIATQDRNAHLEVADGLEARISPDEAERLVRMAATSFRGSRWRDGAGIIVSGVARRLEDERKGIAPPKEDQTVRGMLTIALVFAAIIVLAMIVRARNAKRRLS